MIFSKTFFKNGGWIDSNFEMFAEELTTAEIVKRLKMRTKTPGPSWSEIIQNVKTYSNCKGRLEVWEV